MFHTALKENGEGLSYGITLSNLGSKISYSNDAITKDYIPANMGLGIAYTKVYDEVNKITFACDVNKLMVPTPPADTSANSMNNYYSEGVVSSWFKSFGDVPVSQELKEYQISVGAEYWYNDQFAFRTGYFYEDASQGDRKYFTVGAGLKYNMMGLNFSYVIPSGNGVTRDPLSNTLRFSILFNFAGNGGAKSGK